MIDVSLSRRVDAVVIGTSAGGVEALSVLLPALTAGARASIFIVLHLPRDKRSFLVDVFAPRCALRVCEAEDKEPIAPGTVYFAPSDYHMLIGRGPEVTLSADALVHFSRPSIDVLFESAADVYGPRLLGVILTGASHDGAEGLEAVRRAGGLTVVQRPEESRVPVMTTAALRRGPADLVLPLDDIARLLRSLDPAASPYPTT